MFHLVSFWCFRITQNITLIGLFHKEVGSIRKYSPIILVSTEGYILGLIGFPHIRRLCGNTKIKRRVFADKLVGYS